MLKLPRRKFLHLAAGAGALPALSRIAVAQTYPTRPVRIVVPLGTGGGTDILARLVAQCLSQRSRSESWPSASSHNAERWSDGCVGIHKADERSLIFFAFAVPTFASIQRMRICSGGASPIELGFARAVGAGL